MDWIPPLHQARYAAQRLYKDINIQRYRYKDVRVRAVTVSVIRQFLLHAGMVVLSRAGINKGHALNRAWPFPVVVLFALPYAAACCRNAGANSSSTNVSNFVGVVFDADRGSSALMCPEFKAPAISRIRPTTLADIPICTIAARS